MLVGTDVVLDQSRVDCPVTFFRSYTNGSHHVVSFIDMDRFNMLDSAIQIKVNYLQSVRGLALGL